MTSPKIRGSMSLTRKRILMVLAMLGILSAVAYQLFSTFQSSLVFYITPSELLGVEPAGYDVQKKILSHNKKIRLGGLVKTKSIAILDAHNKRLSFTVTDTNSDINVIYTGFLPDLFREGQGVVAEGTFDRHNNVFNATSLLAKHDETYKPPKL